MFIIQVGMPLLWVSVAFVIGLLIGDWLKLDWLIGIVFACPFLVLAILDPWLCRSIHLWAKLRRFLPIPAGVVLLFVALGSIRFSTTSLPLWQADDLAWYNEKGEFILTGWISAAPDQRDDMTVYQISMIEIKDPYNSDWVHATKKVNGLAQVYVSAGSDWQYGDLLQFTVSPQQPSESRDFSYRDYLAGFNIHTVIYHPQHVLLVGSGYGNPFRAWLIQIRDEARQTIFELYPQPEAGLLTGILLGVDNDLPGSLAESYRDTGTAHIIAISGFNMAVLAGLFMWFFSRLFGPYWAALISSILLLIYTLFVSSSPSVSRALIMAVVGAGGHLIGRRQMGINALAFTAALMCLINPALLYNVSFQLSFAATFGLVVFAEPMQGWLGLFLEKNLSEKWSKKLTNPLSEYYLFTLAAQFATLPVIASHFGRISISALLANPLVLPIQPGVMVLGGITTLAGMIHPLAGRVLMVFSWPFLKYTNFMVTLLAKIKGGVLTIHPSFSIYILFVVILFLLLFFLRQRLSKFFHSRYFIWSVLILAGACFTVWSIYFHRPDGRLHLNLVRSGDEVTVYLQSPGGEIFALDPHGDMDEFTSTLEKDLSPWEFHIDTVMLSDRDAASDLKKLSGQITINRVLLAPASYRLEEGAQPITIPDELEIEKLQAGQQVEIEPGLVILLACEDLQGTALLMEYGSTRVLIPNGVDFATIKSEYPEMMNDLTVLVLDERDVSYIPPRVWEQLDLQVILWASTALSPFTYSHGLDSDAKVNLVSDGMETWLEP